MSIKKPSINKSIKPSRPIHPKEKQLRRLLALLKERGEEGVTSWEGQKLGFGSITKSISILKIENLYNINNQRVKWIKENGERTFGARYVLLPGVYSKEKE